MKWRSRLLRISDADGQPDYENGEVEALTIETLIQDLKIFLGHRTLTLHDNSVSQVVRTAKQRLAGLGWWVIMLAIFLRF